MKKQLLLFCLSLIFVFISCDNGKEPPSYSSNIDSSSYNIRLPQEITDRLNIVNNVLDIQIESQFETNLPCRVVKFFTFTVKEVAYRTIYLADGPIEFASGCNIKTYGCNGGDRIVLIREEFKSLESGGADCFNEPSLRAPIE